MKAINVSSAKVVCSLFMLGSLASCDNPARSTGKTGAVQTASAASVDRALMLPLAENFQGISDAGLQKPSPADWLSWRGDNRARGFSPLDQVNRENVGRLQLAWTWSMEEGETEQEPIVYGGVMFLPHTNGVVQALDARDGKLLWEYRRRLPEGVNGATTRNIAIYNDKIYLTTPDGYLVALNAKSGELVWEVLTGKLDDRVNYSSGPIVGNGRVFAGQTCGTGTSSACSVAAFDAETGKPLWQRESVAGPTDPAAHAATWGQVAYEKRRKASFWLTGSYDAELGLTYWTTASPYPYPEMLKGNTEGGDLLYTNSILALDAATGEIRWYFQMQPRDNFDMDHEDNPILADVMIDGKLRKAVFLLGKPGILWALDRETGQYLWHRQLVSYQNLYSNIDFATGAITMNESLIQAKLGDRQMVCPGMRGGKLFQTNAYHPGMEALFSPVSNACSVYEVVPLELSAGGVNYSELRHMKDSNEQVGRLSAVSAVDGEVMWTYDQRAALGSVLATGGGLVFVGDLHRYFRALDAENGEVLWEVPLNAPVTGYPVSYAAGGKQYIAVGVGGGTSGTRHLSRLYPELNVSHGNNLLMVFAIDK